MSSGLRGQLERLSLRTTTEPVLLTSAARRQAALYSYHIKPHWLCIEQP